MHNETLSVSAMRISSPESFRGCHAVALAKTDLLVNEYVCPTIKSDAEGACALPKLSRNR
jgi:hypothetical protein